MFHDLKGEDRYNGGQLLLLDKKKMVSVTSTKRRVHEEEIM